MLNLGERQTSSMRRLLVSIIHPTQESQSLTNSGTYKRFLATWDAYVPRIRKLLLSTIKADIRAHIAETQPKADLESDQPLQVGDSARYEAELMQELQGATSASKLSGGRLPDAQRREADSADEREDADGEPTILSEEDEDADTSTREAAEEEEDNTSDG